MEIYDYIQVILRKKKNEIIFCIFIETKTHPKKKKNRKPTTSLQQEVYKD